MSVQWKEARTGLLERAERELKAATALGVDAGSVTPRRATTRPRVVDVTAQHHSSS